MRNRIVLAATLLIAVVALVASTASAAEESSDTEAHGVRTSIFHVTGMTCGGCEVAVRRLVGKLEGVEEVTASHKEGTATVTYQTDKVTPDAIIAAIEELGYTAELEADEEEDT